MSERVNRRILDKIEESEFSKEVKNFLKEILGFELKKLDTGERKYTKHYDRIIRKYIEKIG